MCFSKCLVMHANILFSPCEEAQGLCFFHCQELFPAASYMGFMKHTPQNQKLQCFSKKEKFAIIQSYLKIPLD